MKFVGFAGLLAALATGAAAQQVAKPAAAAAEEAKPISRQEVSDNLDTDYAELDADKDGKATAEEIKALLVRKAEADIEVLKKARDEAFAKLDTNGDETISRAEFDARAPLPTIKEPDASSNLAKFDADQDGAITKDEYRAPTLANFDKMDKNKDGTLSVAERKAAAPPTAAKKPAVKKTPVISR